MRPLKLTPCILILAALLGNASPCGANTRDRYYDVRDQFSSEQVIGPVTLHVVGMNPFTDTVGKWDTSSQDIPPADPTSIVSVITGSGQVANAVRGPVPSGHSLDAYKAPLDSQTQMTQKQGEATKSLIRDILVSSNVKELASLLQAAPKHTVAAIQQSKLPAKSKLLAVQDAPNTLSALIRKKPELLAQALLDAKPVVAPVATLTERPIAKSPNPTPSCDESLASTNLEPCLNKLSDDTDALHDQLVPIRKSFRSLVKMSDAILVAHRNVRNAQDLATLRDDVRSCIIDISAKCALASDGRGELVQVKLNELEQTITKAHDTFRDVDREYNRLNVAVAGLADQESAKLLENQLKIIRPILDRYGSIFSRLDAYSQKHLVPLTVAGLGSDDVLITSGFEVRKIETCTGLAIHGKHTTDVLNYLPSPTIQLGSDSDPQKDTNTAENGSSDKTADAAADNPAGKPSPTPAPDSEKTDDSGSPQTRHDDVTVICEPPLFLSVGFAADSLPGTTYTSAAANTAGLPKPAAGATPIPSTIVSSSSGIGPTVVQLANYAFTQDDRGGGLALSAGLGTNATFNSKARADALLGLSYAFARTLVLTGGVSFGPTTQLAPGYVVHGPVVPGATIPTTSSFRAGAFLGVTFVTSGGGPTAAASPSPKPSAKPSDKP